MSKLPSSKSLKGKFSLIGKIDAYLNKAANPPHYENQEPRVKPSDLGSPCMRKIFYSYLRTEPDQKIKPQQKRIFDTGDAFHDMVKDWVKGAKLLIDYKDPKTGELPINKWTNKPDGEFPIVVPELGIKKGKIDAILLIDGKLWIGEFKSIKDEKFHELEGAQEDHKIQANTYVHLFEHCLNKGDYKHIKELEGHTEVEGVIFLYVNKNDSEPREYIVLKDDASFEKIVEKISELKKYVEKNELPPWTEHYCYFCPFNKKCEKDFNPLDVKKSK